MKETYPLISVVVPVYNMENHLERCLSSIQSQTYEKFECLVIDDGSMDRSVEIAHRYVRRDKRFCSLQKKNGGLASARNHGMRYAKGKYIAFLDADDYWLRDKLKEQILRITACENDTCSIVFTQCFVEDATGKQSEYLGEPYQNVPLKLLAGNTVNGSGSSVMIDKNVVSKAGYFNEELRRFEDLEYWFRLAIHGFKFAYCSNPQVIIKRNDDSLSSNRKEMMRANIQALTMQLREISEMNCDYKTASGYILERIWRSRKYFEPNKYISNYLAIIKLIWYFLIFWIKQWRGIKWLT